MTFGWFSVFHLLMIAALLIPNGIYMLQNKQAKNKCASRCMNVMEQIGRYGCILLMILSVEGGTSDGLLAVYEVGSLMCLLLYVLLWRHLLKSKAVYAAFVPIAVLAVLFALLSPVLVVLAVGLTGIVYVMMRASDAPAENRGFAWRWRLFRLCCSCCAALPCTLGCSQR